MLLKKKVITETDTKSDGQELKYDQYFTMTSYNRYQILRINNLFNFELCIT